MSFDTLFVYCMGAVVLAVAYRGIVEFVLPRIRNFRECERCGSMLDENGVCERCNSLAEYRSAITIVGGGAFHVPFEAVRKHPNFQNDLEALRRIRELRK